MRVTLMHNPRAGGSVPVTRLGEWIRGAGHDVVICSTDDDDIRAHLQLPSDVVAVAGGDGTVARVVERLLEAQEPPPLTILPLGIANNIAYSLGIDDISPLDWPRWRERWLDAWWLLSGGSRQLFVEGMGFGLFARLMAQVKGRVPATESLETSTRLLQGMLRQLEPTKVDLSLDGEDYFGRYLLVELMNLPRVGPRLQLVPHADPSDGCLDVVLVEEDEQELLADFLFARRSGSPPPPLRSRRVRRAEFTWEGQTVHRDGKVWPRPEDGISPPIGTRVTVDSAPRGVRILAP